MSNKFESKESYSYNTNNNQDFKESINRSLDETKHNINRSIDESKNQIPRYNTIVNSYQEQSLQAAKEISEQYIDSQKQSSVHFNQHGNHIVKAIMEWSLAFHLQIL